MRTRTARLVDRFLLASLLTCIAATVAGTVLGYGGLGAP